VLVIADRCRNTCWVEDLLTDLPSVELSSGDGSLVGWPGQLRNVTCVGRGLPLPTVQWLYRGGQQVTDNSAFTVVTSRTNSSVTSHLQVRPSVRPSCDWLGGWI